MRWPSQWIVRAGDGCGSAWSPSDRESAFPPYSLADGPAPQGKGNAEGKRSAILGAAADAGLCGIVGVEGRNGDIPQPTRPPTSEGKAPAQTPVNHAAYITAPAYPSAEQDICILRKCVRHREIGPRLSIVQGSNLARLGRSADWEQCQGAEDKKLTSWSEHRKRYHLKGRLPASDSDSRRSYGSRLPW